MWKKLSFKKQLILILLIPVSGLLYFTIADINNAYQNYSKIESSTENIDNITHFSEGIMLINNERALNEYSKFDVSKRAEFKLQMAQTMEWFSKQNSKDSVVLKNINEARTIINKIHYDIENSSDSSLKVFDDYLVLNNILNNLIEREIVNCKNVTIAKLANNIKSYVDSKTSVNLIRGIVFDKLTDDSVHTDLLGYYDNLKNLSRNADFRLENNNDFKINDEIIQFKKSAEFQSFFTTSETILNNTARVSPKAWWDQSTKVNNKLNELKVKRLNNIVELAKQEKEQTVSNTITSVILLVLLLIATAFSVYKLVSNTSTSLNIIATKIGKIAVGFTDFQHTLTGNVELDSIRESLKKLTTAIKGQINLATEISSGNFGNTITVRSESDTLNQSLNKMSLELKRFNDEANENTLLEKIL